MLKKSSKCHQSRFHYTCMHTSFFSSSVSIFFFFFFFFFFFLFFSASVWVSVLFVSCRIKAKADSSTSSSENKSPSFSIFPQIKKRSNFRFTKDPILVQIRSGKFGYILCSYSNLHLPKKTLRCSIYHMASFLPTDE